MLSEEFEPVISEIKALKSKSFNVQPPELAGTYTGCPRRNGQNFGRVFLMLNFSDITQNTYTQI